MSEMLLYLSLTESTHTSSHLPSKVVAVAVVVAVAAAAFRVGHALKNVVPGSALYGVLP